MPAVPEHYKHALAPCSRRPLAPAAARARRAPPSATRTPRPPPARPRAAPRAQQMRPAAAAWAARCRRCRSGGSSPSPTQMQRCDRGAASGACAQAVRVRRRAARGCLQQPAGVCDCCCLGAATHPAAGPVARPLAESRACRPTHLHTDKHTPPARHQVYSKAGDAFDPAKKPDRCAAVPPRGRHFLSPTPVRHRREAPGRSWPAPRSAQQRGCAGVDLTA